MGQQDPTSPPSSGALDGGFHFSLSDGEHASPGHFFRVTAQKQLLLSLEGSRTLTVCPGGSVSIGMPVGRVTPQGHAASQQSQASPWLLVKSQQAPYPSHRVGPAAEQPEPESQLQCRHGPPPPALPRGAGPPAGPAVPRPAGRLWGGPGELHSG